MRAATLSGCKNKAISGWGANKNIAMTTMPHSRAVKIRSWRAFATLSHLAMP